MSKIEKKNTIKNKNEETEETKRQKTKKMPRGIPSRQSRALDL